MFKGINFEELERLSKTNSIGCPFNQHFGGPVKTPYVTKYSIRKNSCSSLCGKIFGNDYTPMKCPCWHLDEEIVKKTFWKAVEEWRKPKISIRM